MPEMKPLHIPEEKPLRLGMDGEDVSCEGEFGFGGDSEPWRLWAEAGDPEHIITSQNEFCIKHEHNISTAWVFGCLESKKPEKPVQCFYLSVWGWAVHYCEQICGFCFLAYDDLQPWPQQGRRQKEEDVSPYAWRGLLSPLSDESARPESPSYVCEQEKKGRKTITLNLSWEATFMG